LSILALIARVVLWLAVAAWLLVKFFRWVFRPASRRTRAAASRPQRGVEPKQLHRDPWCGTFVSSEISHKLEQDGEVHHFCSAGCRERFLRSARRTASA
jgi:YHS domain-containing protein